MREAIYPGSFDPITHGHIDHVHRGLASFDRIVVATAVNLRKHPLVSDEDRLSMLRETFVEVPGLSSLLEGALRPGHFRGVSTVVTKLFNLVQPDVACFGQKDYQQLALIRKMVADMAMPVEIVGVPTVRAEDGLALSSRNGYLTAAERALAPELARTMNWIAEQIEAGNHHLPSLVAQASQRLDNAGFRTDAIDIVDADTLESSSAASKRLVILMAAYLGKARLIDNRVVTLQG